jgi:hypothetical protein
MSPNAMLYTPTLQESLPHIEGALSRMPQIAELIIAGSVYALTARYHYSPGRGWEVEGNSGTYYQVGLTTCTCPAFNLGKPVEVNGVKWCKHTAGFNLFHKVLRSHISQRIFGSDFIDNRHRCLEYPGVFLLLRSERTLMTVISPQTVHRLCDVRQHNGHYYPTTEHDIACMAAWLRDAPPIPQQAQRVQAALHAYDRTLAHGNPPDVAATVADAVMAAGC